jgi:hypothetical protein
MAASRSTPQLQQKMSVMDDLLGLEGGFKPSKNPWETMPTSSLASGASPNPFQPKSDPWNSGTLLMDRCRDDEAVTVVILCTKYIDGLPW